MNLIEHLVELSERFKMIPHIFKSVLLQYSCRTFPCSSNRSVRFARIAAEGPQKSRFPPACSLTYPRDQHENFENRRSGAGKKEDRGTYVRRFPIVPSSRVVLYALGAQYSTSAAKHKSKNQIAKQAHATVTATTQRKQQQQLYKSKTERNEKEHTKSKQ